MNKLAFYFLTKEATAKLAEEASKKPSVAKIDTRLKQLERLGEEIKYLKKSSRGSWWTGRVTHNTRGISKVLYGKKFYEKGSKLPGKLLSKNPTGVQFVPFGIQASSSRAHRGFEKERRKQIKELQAKRNKITG